jgi:hypothetical protein
MMSKYPVVDCVPYYNNYPSEAALEPFAVQEYVTNAAKEDIIGMQYTYTGYLPCFCQVRKEAGFPDHYLYSTTADT